MELSGLPLCPLQVVVAHEADVLGVPEPGAGGSPGRSVLTGFFNKAASRNISVGGSLG